MISLLKTSKPLKTNNNNNNNNPSCYTNQEPQSTEPLTHGEDRWRNEVGEERILSAPELT